MFLQIIPLYWNKFVSNLANNLTDLHTHNEFADVTLVSDDGTKFAAHKSILSSSSPILKAILLDHSSPDPIILMTDVLPEHISAILQFIYLGEVKVLRSCIGTFLEIGKELQIKEISIMNRITEENYDVTADRNAGEVQGTLVNEITNEENLAENSLEVMLKEECNVLEQVKTEQTEKAWADLCQAQFKLGQLIKL